MKFEINRGGTLYTIESVHRCFGIRDGARWVATRNGGADTILGGRNQYDVLQKLVDQGVAAELRLPSKLHDWNEVRR